MTQLMIQTVSQTRGKKGERNLLQNAFQAQSNYEVGKFPSCSFHSSTCAIFCKVIQHFQHMHYLRTKMLDYSWILKVCQMHVMVSKQMEYILCTLVTKLHDYLKIQIAAWFQVWIVTQHGADSNGLSLSVLFSGTPNSGWAKAPL